MKIEAVVDKISIMRSSVVTAASSTNVVLAFPTQEVGVPLLLRVKLSPFGFVWLVADEAGLSYREEFHGNLLTGQDKNYKE
jgi:hypothetical protein